MYTLVTSWNQPAAATHGNVVLVLTASADTLGPADTATVTASVQSDNSGTPTGIVTFYLGDAALGTAPLSGTGNTAVATITVDGAQLGGGSGTTISAQYGGDGTYASASSSLTVAAAAAVPQ